MSIGEFLGFGGYQRAAEGYMSWQHLTFVTSLVIVMVVSAVLLGRNYKGKSEKEKNRVMIAAAILINAVEIFKIVVLCIRYEDPWHWRNVLPLFLCSIQLIAIPMAAFSKGRLKEASLDFVVLFGLLGAILGTYFAGNNYDCYPVISLDNVAENTTAAESRIRDTDMATEMVKFSQQDILSQAGQAILAQVKNNNQGVLTLLQ